MNQIHTRWAFKALVTGPFLLPFASLDAVSFMFFDGFGSSLADFDPFADPCINTFSEGFFAFKRTVTSFIQCY